MQFWQYALIAFVFVFALKLFTNVVYFFKANHYLALHNRYVLSNDMEIDVYQPAVEKLLKRAGIQDFQIADAEPLGYGHVHTRYISVIKNAQNKRGDIVIQFHRLLTRVKGVYLLRIKECFSPIYWIECVLFLPRHVLDYLGIGQDKVGYKISNILPTFIWWCLGIAIAVFRDNIRLFIVNFLAENK